MHLQGWSLPWVGIAALWLDGLSSCWGRRRRFLSLLAVYVCECRVLFGEECVQPICCAMMVKGFHVLTDVPSLILATVQLLLSYPCGLTLAATFMGVKRRIELEWRQVGNVSGVHFSIGEVSNSAPELVVRRLLALITL